jgi:two-component system sensor histidine kinase KdpD
METTMSAGTQERDRRRSWVGYAAATAAAIVCTLLGLAMVPRFDIVNVAMVYLLAVVLIALRYSRFATLYGAVVCVAAFDFIFVPPHGRFSVDDAQYLFTFAIMAGVGLVISGLLDKARRESDERSAASLAAETERIRSTLLASISHDLRTPLAVMAGASSSLAEGGERISAAERAALAQSIYAQAREMSEQVAKVLQMTRLEMGALAIDRDWVSMAEIIGTVLARYSSRLASHHVIVAVAEELPLVRADATLIDQALSNLIENAARHTPAGTPVAVRAAVQGSELVVSVEDHGPGIDQAHADQVFDKFYHRSHDGNPVGVGLGLAICRAIVRLHGGRVWADNVPGGGAVFRFSLPVDPAPAPPTEVEAEGGATRGAH